MLLYRTFPHLGSARAGQPGHPLYVHPNQGQGRWDNPAWYLALHMTQEPTSAVVEVFADLPDWSEDMFAFPEIAGARRALGVYRVADDLPYVDLDDAATLVARGMRPSQVVARNRPYTQAKALEIHQERRWSGLRWWSFHHPDWRVWCLWDIKPVCEEVQELDLDHPAVQDAATALAKSFA
jgi:hypothetical protein